MSETAIQRAIVEALAALGIVVARTHSGQVRVRRGYMHLAPEGWPDLSGYLPGGRALFIEVKDPKGKTDKARAERQAAWRERAVKAGCLAFVATSSAEAVARVIEAQR